MYGESKCYIFRDKDGQNVVLINDIKFRTRRIVDWKYIEEYLTKVSKNSPSSTGGR